MPENASVKQWSITNTDGFDSLKLVEAQLPQLGDSEVLVKSTFMLPYEQMKQSKANRN